MFQFTKDVVAHLDSIRIDLRGIILLEAEGKQNLLDFSEAGLSEINYADYLEEVTHLTSHPHNISWLVFTLYNYCCICERSVQILILDYSCRNTVVPEVSWLWRPGLTAFLLAVTYHTAGSRALPNMSCDMTEYTGFCWGPRKLPKRIPAKAKSVSEQVGTWHSLSSPTLPVTFT